MPYQWSETSPPARLRLWPHRSMTNSGFAWFMGATIALVCLPLVAVAGSPVMWALLPFVIGAVGLTMFAIRWKDHEMTMSEELTIGETTVALVRREVHGPERRWEANPHWVQVALHKAGGPVENYVTLKGGDREVEIGAFLSPDERAALYDDLSRRLPARP